MRCFVCLAVLLAGSCGPSGPPPAIDRSMTSCVPEGSQVLAGVQMQRLRESALYTNLPASALATLEPLHSAFEVLLVLNGNDILVIARGQFQEAIAGGTLLDPHLMLVGSPASIRAATAQHRKRRPAATELLAHAETLARSNPVWMVAEGNANLPITGNGDNINRLLHLTSYSTFTARIGPAVELEAAAICRTPDDARRLEETLRAFVSLSILGTSRHPEIADLLRTIQVRRENPSVRLTLTAPADALGGLLHFLAQ